ncbi:MAG: NifB/NifX family molybdenum-iron cluster-binding protein [Thermoplasmata archaeon]
MRICIATSGSGGINDFVSTVFGRCPTFTIVDIEGNEIKNIRVIQNPGYVSGSGAGVLAAQEIVNEGCNVLISGSVGPNSYQVLMAGHIDMRASPPTSVKDAINLFLEGKLPVAVPVHGGGRRGMGMGMGRGHGPW